MRRRLVVLLAWTLWALTMVAISAFFWLQQERQGPFDATFVALLLATVSAATVGRCWPAAGRTTR